MTSAKIKPPSSNIGVILNANAICANVCQFIVPVVNPFNGSTATLPATPPTNEINSASIRNEMTTAGRAESQRAHRRNLAPPLGHRGVHGIQRAENGSDRHHCRNQSAQNADQLVMRVDCFA